MPWSSPRPCRDCKRHLTRDRSGLCDGCRKIRNERYATRRHTTADDSYYHTSGWRSLRQAKLARQPLCEPCLEGRCVHGIKHVVPAVGCNHKIARRDGGPDSLDNLESCCAPDLNAADPRGVVRWLAVPK